MNVTNLQDRIIICMTQTRATALTKDNKDIYTNIIIITWEWNTLTELNLQFVQ